jgi:hypothetical protein
MKIKVPDNALLVGIARASMADIIEEHAKW